MSCSTCGGSSTRRMSIQQVQQLIRTNPEELIVKKSESKALVHLRYYGAGMGMTSSGCSSCSSGGKYSLVTSETIQFASDDAPLGWFSKRFDVAHDYYVTEKQAEHLLKETFTNAAGQEVSKFKVIE